MLGIGWPLEPSAYPTGPEGLLVGAVVLVVGAAVVGYLWWVERPRRRPTERREELRKAA